MKHPVILVAAAVFIAGLAAFASPVMAQSGQTPAQLAKACKKDGAMCYGAAEAYATGAGVKANPKKALELAKTGCETHGDRNSCLIGGSLIADSGIADAGKESLKYIFRICRADRMADCITANDIYLDANAETAPGESAAGWYDHRKMVEDRLKVMCEAGQALACRAFGASRAHNHRLNTQSHNTNLLSIQAYRMGCDLDDGPSCAALVPLFQETNAKMGVSPDPAAAEAFAAKACRLGEATACSTSTPAEPPADRVDPTLSYPEQMLVAELALENGKTQMALDALNRLAQEERPEAGLRLGVLYLQGESVPADRRRAIGYLEASEHPDAAMLRAQLAVQDGDTAKYDEYMNKAYWAGNKAAEPWFLARQRAYLDAAEARDKEMIAQARRNDAENARYEAELINRAMNNYYLPKKTEPMVCGLFREGGGLVNKCLSREYYMKKYP